MTGTDHILFTHKQSRSYLNHPVCVSLLALTRFGHFYDHLQGVPQYKYQKYNRNHTKFILEFSEILSNVKAVWHLLQIFFQMW
jgi:hypothetical protein